MFDHFLYSGDVVPMWEIYWHSDRRRWFVSFFASIALQNYLECTHVLFDRISFNALGSRPSRVKKDMSETIIFSYSTNAHQKAN